MNPLEAANQYVTYGGDWTYYTRQMTQEELEAFWDEVWTLHEEQVEEWANYDRYNQEPILDWADY